MRTSTAAGLAFFLVAWTATAFTVPSSLTSTTTKATTYANSLERISTLRSEDDVCQGSSSTSLYGIPKMFRWLTDQYPDIVNRQLQEGLAPDLDVDSFYLDMNGIIHPCTHGNNENDIVLLDETAMFKKIFLYVDRLYKMVKPSKVLYLAVDGVAPRAKMNQQRSRRFRSAKEAEIMASQVIARKNAANGSGMQGKTDEEWLAKRFDSNCITPGTDFMLKLSITLQKWVEFKMKTDPFWQNGADVIVSGPDVPGEGEHKVMDHIREAREEYHKRESEGTLEDESLDPIHYAPDWTHVLYGLDADLIMLGLVSHEPNFMLLREKMSVVMAGRGRNKHRKKKDMMEYTQNDFEVLELSSLRQLLSIQFRRFADDNEEGGGKVLQEEFDLNRIVDDFVFMCMLVGNDFLSHMPHMEIDGGAISLMMGTYIELLPEWGGYLTKRERIHPARFEQFLYDMAVFEEEHFKRRGFEENEPGWKLTADAEDLETDFYGKYFSGDPTPKVAQAAAKKGAPEPAEMDDPNIKPAGNRSFRRKYPTNPSRSYRDFYYETKMGWKASDRDRTLFRRRAHVRDYLEGLHWNLNYYHNGCAAWDWYFPHLYSPLCTDMANLDEFYEDEGDEEGFKAFDFDLGTPFPSLGQLLSVLPPQSAALLPKPLGELMLEPSSPLTSYYPNDFTSDPNGKRQPWEAVVQIPFIDSDVLLETLQQILDADKEKPILTKGERLRNRPGKRHVFLAPHDAPEQEEESPEDKVKKARRKKPAKMSAKPKKEEPANRQVRLVDRSM